MPQAAPLPLASLLLSLLPVLTGTSLNAKDDYKVEALKEAPPQELSKELVQVLQSEGLRITGPDGKAVADLWLRKELETREAKAELGIDYGHVPEGVILGAIKFHQDGKDFRDNRFKSGVFTCRYALQPQDGDHLGASETRDFIILCPAKEDASIEALPAKEAVKLSTKVSGSKHPAVLYLIKLFDDPKDGARMVEDGERGYWLLDCKIPGRVPAKKAVRLSIVLIGKAAEA